VIGSQWFFLYLFTGGWANLIKEMAYAHGSLGIFFSLSEISGFTVITACFINVIIIKDGFNEVV